MPRLCEETGSSVTGGQNSTPLCNGAAAVPNTVIPAAQMLAFVSGPPVFAAVPGERVTTKQGQPSATDVVGEVVMRILRVVLGFPNGGDAVDHVKRNCYNCFIQQNTEKSCKSLDANHRLIRDMER